MDSIEKVIISISLPLLLPQEAFLPVGKSQILTVESLLSYLPTELTSFIDLTKTAFCKKRNSKTSYFLPNADAAYLEIVLEDQTIVEINKLDVL
jgi:hypothetical protein